MKLRQAEIILPAEREAFVREALEGVEAFDPVFVQLRGGDLLLRVLLPESETERFLDALRSQSDDPSVSITMLPVALTAPEYDDDEGHVATARKEPLRRVSRQELHDRMQEGTRFDREYVLLLSLSALVAAVGLLRDQVAVVIGAMIVAPLLRPNIALALATTLGDLELGRQALSTGLRGMGIGLAIAVAIGLLLPVSLESAELAARATVHPSDLLLALAAGCAGVLAFTTTASESLIGVMVAVALMPPVMALGMFVGAGEWVAARGALLLLAANVVCVNFAGVLTFVVQGVRPLTWYEASAARAGLRRALVLWFLLLATLAVVILLIQ